jgi:hypothetical protein
MRPRSEWKAKLKWIASLYHIMMRKTFGLVESNHRQKDFGDLICCLEESGVV